MAIDDFKPGQLKGGWNQVARDLDRAFVIAQFSSLQMLLIEQARELSYTESKVKGLMEPLPFRLNYSELARIAGCAREALSRGFKALVECRVFFTYKENLYMINKDYRLWLASDGRPRLTDEQVAWCRAVIRDEVEPADSVNLPVTFSSQCTDVSVTETSQCTKSTVTEKSQHRDEKVTVGVPPIPPVLERREYNNNGVVVDDGINPSKQDSSQPSLRSARRPEATPEQVARLVAWARETLGERCELESFDCKIAPYTRSYPIAWIEEAILAANAGADPGGLDRYVNKVLINMHKAGGPEKPPQRNGVPSGPALPPPAPPAPPGFKPKFTTRKKDQ